jgi:3-oxoacyl-[acyl-carrier-protein] synthase II
VSRRVAITGIGLMTSLGAGRQATWEAALAGRSGTGRPTRLDPGFGSVRVVAEVSDFAPEGLLPPKVLARTDLNAQFAFLAGGEAMADSGVELTDDLRARTGVVMAANYGGMAAAIEGLTRLHQQGPSFVSPFTSTAWLPFAPVGQLSIGVGLTGYCKTVLADAAGGVIAIGLAAEAVARGEVDLVVAGGAESPLTDLCLAAMATSDLTCTDADDPAAAHRPFDLGRRGGVVGEGGGMLLLEEADHAAARGARIYAYVAGFGQTGDGVRPTLHAPDGGQYGRAMAQALERGGLAPADVGLVSADGQATEAGDRAEAAALRAVFGDALDGLAVTAPKSMLGSSLSGSGAIEVALAAMALHAGQVPPTINVTDPDPDCDLPLVTGAAAASGAGAALVCGRGGGGVNAVVALRAP